MAGESVSSGFAEVEHWAYEVESPFRPPADIAIASRTEADDPTEASWSEGGRDEDGWSATWQLPSDEDEAWEASASAAAENEAQEDLDVAAEEFAVDEAWDHEDPVHVRRPTAAAEVAASSTPSPGRGREGDMARAVRERGQQVYQRVFGHRKTEFIDSLDDLTIDHLFANVWSREELSIANRSRITVALLAALGRDDELNLHLRGALNQGLTRGEIAEVMVHVAHYAGWPAGHRGLKVLRDLEFGKLEPFEEFELDAAYDTLTSSSGASPQGFVEPRAIEAFADETGADLPEPVAVPPHRTVAELHDHDAPEREIGDAAESLTHDQDAELASARRSPVRIPEEARGLRRS